MLGSTVAKPEISPMRTNLSKAQIQRMEPFTTCG